MESRGVVFLLHSYRQQKQTIMLVVKVTSKTATPTLWSVFLVVTIFTPSVTSVDGQGRYGNRAVKSKLKSHCVYRR